MTLKENQRRKANVKKYCFSQVHISICLQCKKVSGKIFTSCYSFDRKNLCSEIREIMSFSSSCKLGNKQRSSVDGGGGGGGRGECRKTDNVFVEKKNDISLLSKNDFCFMCSFQILTEQNYFQGVSQKIKFRTKLFLTYAPRSE